MKRINIEEIGNIHIAHVENKEAATGCSVVICKEGAACGLSVAGGGPASRESELLKPVADANVIHAILLSGGSAFGLDAAGGVMAYLEQQNIGFDTGITKVPLVCQSCLFDLSVADKDIRPDQTMGYACAKKALSSHHNEWGNVGAGCGASVGKLKGMEYAMKSGIGSYAIQIGELKIGAMVAVNALGDIYDYQTNQKIAGLLNEQKDGFQDSVKVMVESYKEMALFNTNTTLAIIITNAQFDKTKMNKIAAMAQNGYARSIKPVHTNADGDSIYAMSCGNVKADINVVGTLAADVISEAIKDAIYQSESAYGLKGYDEIKQKGV
ncbi:MAG: peptidase S58 family protein [Erysipelotrichia bacterium]|nr:peptidase S58 family protein [Erysipelotrichia bacterium]NCC55255.1 peptidase S58 family protein [Erysipelotrichia bacterium]